MAVKKTAKKKIGRPKGSTKAAKERRIAAAEGRSPAALRGHIQKLAEELGVDPFERLMKRTNDPKVSQKEKVNIYKMLLPYMAPTLKAVDMQQDMKMNVTVQLQSFAGARQGELRDVTPRKPREYYEQFLEAEDTDKTPELFGVTGNAEASASLSSPAPEPAPKVKGGVRPEEHVGDEGDELYEEMMDDEATSQ